MVANLEDADFPQDLTRSLVIEDIRESLDSKGLTSPSMVRLSDDAVASLEWWGCSVDYIRRIKQLVVRVYVTWAKLPCGPGEEILYFRPAKRLSVSKPMLGDSRLFHLQELLKGML